MAARVVLPASAHRRVSAMLNWTLCAKSVGIGESNKLLSAERYSGPAFPVHPRSLSYPIRIRPGTPDSRTVVETVIREAYSAYLPTGTVSVIVDAGAYIGDTAAWYLSRFSRATVIALEPDEDSFAELALNCSFYGSRAVLLKAALWPTEATLVVRRGENPVLNSVTECTGGSSGITLPALMRSVHAEKVDILKLDIEGAEHTLISAPNAAQWLARTRSIAMEIHGNGSELVGVLTQRHHFRHRCFRDIHFFTQAGS